MKEIPSELLRFIEKEEYAQSFIKGEIRFGLLDCYRNIEGTRRDEKEGRESLYWKKKAKNIILNKRTGVIIEETESDQNIHSIGSSLHSHYILCTSHPEANIDFLKKKYGNFIVRINNPLKLLERIRGEWRNHQLAYNDCAFISPVVYNKDDLLVADPYLLSPPSYSYAQKPSSDALDREYRYVLKCNVNTERKLEDYIILKVPDCRDICSVNSRDTTLNCEQRVNRAGHP